MKKVTREEIVDFITYGDLRDDMRAKVLEIKRERRYHAGEHLTFLFENADTVLYQIQEMMRIENIVRESDILHELETYNEVLGGPGELGCTLLIEIDDPAKRDVLLRRWIKMMEHIFVEVEGGQKVYCSFDHRQVGEERLSSVQYIKFDSGGRVPLAVGCDLESCDVKVLLTEQERGALGHDLASDT